jgi:hypothetical protein
MALNQRCRDREAAGHRQGGRPESMEFGVAGHLKAKSRNLRKRLLELHCRFARRAIFWLCTAKHALSQSELQVNRPSKARHSKSGDDAIKRASRLGRSAEALWRLR